MAGKQGKEPYDRKRALRYFFLNGLLHKKLHIDRGNDTIMTWCYPLEKRIAYTYSDVKRRKETAFTTKQVCEMVNRGIVTVEMSIVNGDIEAPQFTYSLDENRRKYKYLWSEKDILALHAALAVRHIGRKRNDGAITSKHLPTVRELRAMIRQEELLYVKVGDEFMPAWKAQDFT